MKNIKGLVLFLCLSVSTVMGQGSDLAKILSNSKIDKAQMKQMLQFLKQSGRISDDQANKAINQVDALSESDIENLQKKAVESIKSGKAAEILKGATSQGPSSKLPKDLPKEIPKNLLDKLKKSKKSSGFKLDNFQ